MADYEYRPYKGLKVFQESYRVALEIHKLCEPFPKFEQYGGLADQMRRASKGVCANIAEGLGKHSTALEEKRFLNIALGSVEELRLWLDFAEDLEYIKQDVTTQLRASYTDIAKMLFSLIRKRAT